ncbi:hypothetical protein CVD28_01340 [Bacillus sp. M6-12]|uniref:hypothetical protein n=1 Tax=Bacillus sp. M6-12 TaxID=2054166 RepID=UPI000C7878F5|nr:hypothetical protein [Bacillus sp. M6-12]PLS19078.1 hypothetical protein CVD28_01340 [Bacillus sp. M6-12]
MNLFKEIENWSRKGIAIEYAIIDQIENGYAEQVNKGHMPPVTYTVYVNRMSDGETLYAESFDEIEEALVAGVKYAETHIK